MNNKTMESEIKVMNEIIDEFNKTYADGDESEILENPKIKILTDDIIAQYSEDNVLTEYRDIDLHVTTKVAPYPNGIYDHKIFGSIFSDRCNCGTVRTTGLRCPRCGSIVLDEIQSFKRFARIESPVYFVNKYNFNQLFNFIRGNFGYRLVLTGKLNLDQLTRNDQKIAYFDICQWNYDKENNTLILTDEITDFTKCSYEGLIKLFSEFFPESLSELRAYINQYILVTPLVVRAPQLRVINGSKRLDNHYISTIYRNIIYAIQEYYPNTLPTMKSEFGKAIFRGSLRRLITTSLSQMSQLMRTSKENLARYMQKNRLPNSGRGVVVPDPSLTADEVIIPRHLMYETCRDEFIKFISDKKGLSLNESERIYKTQANLTEVQDLFDEYINGDGTPNSGKYVIINRQPSLHEMSMFSCKVKLTNDYTIKIPMVLCEPTNGDFDGDQFAYYVVPNDKNELVNNALSAKNRFFYRKNQVPIYRPKDDMMHGLILATKIDPQKSPKVFDTLDEVKQYKKDHPEFKLQTEIILEGRKTTLGREILSELFDKDVNAYIRDCGTPNLTPKNMVYLYTQLSEKEDRLKRIQKIQEFSLNTVTVSGSTATKLSEFYMDIDESYLNKIKVIESRDDLDNAAKDLAIREIYQEFEDAHLKKIPEGLRMIINESGRAKATGLRDMVVQRLQVGQDHSFHITETSLVEGLDPYDYMWHATENRLLQTIKQGAVPQSGYLTRQFIYLASEYTYLDSEDKDNEGILIEERYANGRTTVDGKLIENPDPNSNKLIRIRSCITGKQENIITKDMISPLINYNKGSRIGMSLITSVTEQLTQSGLSLKHGGSLYSIDIDEDTGYGCYIAPANGTVELTEDWILFNSPEENKVYKYPRSDNFKEKFSSDGNWKKGEIFGVNYHQITPSFKLTSVIKLCGAKPSPNKQTFANDSVTQSLCYAISDGILKYEMVDGYIYASINGEDYYYDPACCYTLPDGAKVKKGDRICTGVLNMPLLSNLVTDRIELYYLFRKQFKELIGNSLADELIEFVYLLISKETDQGTLIQSVNKNIYDSDSFYKTLAYADNRKSFGKIGYEGIDFVADPITSVMLSLITNDKIL